MNRWYFVVLVAALAAVGCGNNKDNNDLDAL